MWREAAQVGYNARTMNKNKKKIIYIAGAIVLVLLAIFAVMQKVPFGSQVEPGCEDNAVFNINTGNPCIIIDVNGATTTVNSLNTLSSEEAVSYARISSEWTWKETKYSRSGWAPSKPDPKKPFSLTLNADGKLSIAGDCNSINGSYSLSENIVSGSETIDELALGKIKFGEFASTKMACGKSLEEAFKSDLAKVSTYEMRPTALTLSLADGQGTMTFVRNITTEGQ